jgi:FAD/FMN-containing dehydrogenase
MSRVGESWGRWPEPQDQQLLALRRRHDPLPVAAPPLLAYGQGRSYGDSCLNSGGTLLLARGLDHFLHFDPGTGLIACEAGATLGEVLEIAVPQGWFLPVVPGTRLATVGGALANDVHGKPGHLGRIAAAARGRAVDAGGVAALRLAARFFRAVGAVSRKP